MRGSMKAERSSHRTKPFRSGRIRINLCPKRSKWHHREGGSLLLPQPAARSTIGGGGDFIAGGAQALSRSPGGHTRVFNVGQYLADEEEDDDDEAPDEDGG